MRWAIIDSSVYVGVWERGLHQEVLADVRRSHIIRHSAVVLSELRRGARTPAALRTVEGLHRIARAVWEPTSAEWWEAGRIIQSIGDANHWETAKRRDFQNDTLIFLTARRHGAAVVTANHGDFELLATRFGGTVIRA
jgi:predicted nucleic acid-binding protein